MMNDTNVPSVQDLKLPVALEDLADDADLGGKVSLRDMSIPYLYILQGLSPQVQPASPEYIKGASIAMLYMTVADALFPGDTGLPIVSCYYERVINEWVPRTKGGGLVATHNPESDILSKAKAIDPQKPVELYLPNGNLVVETAYHYILAKREGKFSPTVFPLKSTALKHSRKWLSNINDIVIPGTTKMAPRWLFEWQLTTGPETRADKIWYSPIWKRLEMVDRDTYAMAKEYAKIAATGMLRRPMEDYEQSEESHTSEADSPI
jgi:hypothetical protein